MCQGVWLIGCRGVADRCSGVARGVADRVQWCSKGCG